MDFNSGRFPLDSISFYLHMSSEEMLEKNTLTSPGAAGNIPLVVQYSSVETEGVQSGKPEVSGQVRDMQTSSPSTE